MPLDLAQPAPGAFARIPQAWRTPLLRLALAWAALVALAWRDWAEMAHQWWDISTYNHILLIPPILAWLVRIRWPELSRLTPGAATGIDAKDGLHWRVAESDAGFASAALDLLSDPAGAGELAAAARRFVIERMSWPAMLARLPRILSASGEGCRDAA
jgi:hypothetical protein